MARSIFYVLRALVIARQRVAKHVPAEAYRGTMGRPFLGNGAVNTPTNCLETVFSVGSVKSVYKRGVPKFRSWQFTRVEAGSNTSTVTLRVAGGDEKGSLKSETVKYGHEFQGTRTRERLPGEGQ
jgi:hypothetical protein